MARYHYQARNAEGHLTEGFVDAEDSVAAQQQLQSEGLTIESIRLSPSNLHRVGRSRQTAEVPVDQLSGKSDAILRWLLWVALP